MTSERKNQHNQKLCIKLPLMQAIPLFIHCLFVKIFEMHGILLLLLLIPVLTRINADFTEQKNNKTLEIELQEIANVQTSESNVETMENAMLYNLDIVPCDDAQLPQAK